MEQENYWDYNRLKSAIIAHPMGRSELEYLKSLFKLDINSLRQVSCIKSLDQLLDILERRDKLSEYNIKPLQVVSEGFSDENIEKALKSYVPPKRPAGNQNIYKLKRLKGTEYGDDVDAHGKRKPPFTVFLYTEKKKKDIYKLIAQDIGKDWRAFGRELLVSPGDLDAIEIAHPTDLRSRVFKMLQVFENDPRHDPKQFYNIICNALDGCKRKVLRRDVQRIMSY